MAACWSPNVYQKWGSYSGSGAGGGTADAYAQVPDRVGQSGGAQEGCIKHPTSRSVLPAVCQYTHQSRKWDCRCGERPISEIISNLWTSATSPAEREYSTQNQ